MKLDIKQLQWTREPESYTITPEKIEIETNPHTDLWQRTYYHFRNDNAPVLQMETEEKYFSFVVKTEFTQSHHRYAILVREEFSCLINSHEQGHEQLDSGKLNTGGHK